MLLPQEEALLMLKIAIAFYSCRMKAARMFLQFGAEIEAVAPALVQQLPSVAVGVALLADLVDFDYPYFYKGCADLVALFAVPTTLLTATIRFLTDFLYASSPAITAFISSLKALTCSEG